MFGKDLCAHAIHKLKNLVFENSLLGENFIFSYTQENPSFKNHETKHALGHILKSESFPYL